MPKTMNLAMYSSDPFALDPFHGFDPESHAGMIAIADGLLCRDLDGHLQPALATSWDAPSPTTLDFELRQGVSFHDGQPFDADDVVATFRVHLDPARRSLTGRALFTDVLSCERVDRYRVRLRLRAPDRLLLQHLPISSAIYPQGLLSRGLDELARRPVGTGPFRLVRWERGHQIVLDRFPQHFRGSPPLDRLCLPIVPQKRWISLLQRGRLDAAVNLDPIGARLAQQAGLLVIARRSTCGRWFQLCNHGALADRRVRLALNLAVDRRVLATVAEGNWGRPQVIGPCAGDGPDADLRPHAYDPQRATQLLREAGYGAGLRLRGICSDTSVGTYLFVKEYLGRVGVTLEETVLPRSAWVARMNPAGDRSSGFDGDFAFFHADNPTLDPLFHHLVALSSHGPYSLTRHAEHDALIEAARRAPGEAGVAAVRRLERHAHEQALLLATTTLDGLAAVRPGYELSLSPCGQIDSAVYMSLRAPEQECREGWPGRPPRGPATELDVLREGCRHLGVFYLEQPPRGLVSDIWEDILLMQERWHVQMAPVLREVVDRGEAVRDILDNVVFGFFVVGADLRVRDGSTRSCEGIFGTDRVVGRRLVELLPDLEEGQGRELELHLQQVFEDELPSELVLDQMRQRYAVGGRAVRLVGRAVRDETGGVKGVLFTVTDETEQMENERKARHHQLLVEILGRRDEFRAFVGEAQESLELAAMRLSMGDEVACRGLLHTVKGNAGAHGLVDLMRRVHEIESGEQISAAQVEEIAEWLRRFLRENRVVLEMDPDGFGDEDQRVSAEQVKELEGHARGIGGEAGHAIMEWLARVRARPARVYVGPVERLVERLADRQGKRVRLEMIGLERRVDPGRMGRVLSVVPHLLRNAVDHGIEVMSERGGKPPWGTVVVELTEGAAGYAVTVRDDGRGIDRVKVLARAVERGEVGAAEGAKLSGEERLGLIFGAGVSTADEVTESSGRGQGMGVVKAVVEERGGRVVVESAMGLGTRIKLLVPR